MQTVQIEVSEDKLELFLTIVGNLKNDIVQNIKIPNKSDLLDIEAIEKGSVEHQEIESIKAQNNPKYSLKEAKEQLGL
jgi:hypothetical protein